MKKILIRALVYILVFVTAVLIFGKLMSRKQVNMLVDMDPASQPVIYMSIEDIRYNMLPGYSTPRNISYDRDSLTYINSSRSIPITIDTFGSKVAGASYELRNIEDGRLIEEGETDLIMNNIGNLKGKIELKDLITDGAEYSLEIILSMEDGREIYYYTRVIKGDEELAYDKIAYAKYFHDCLFDKKTAEAIKKHLETNSSLNDNSTFAYVDIHSSFSQITYGDLEVTPYGEPGIYLKEDSGRDATVYTDYMLRSGYGTSLTAYKAHEEIKVRYTQKGIYILSYIRTMEEIANPADMCVNDKITLGIAGEDPEMMESPDGKCVAFVSGGRLFMYNEKAAKLACAYSFYDYGVFDVRNIYDRHDIRILDIDDDGNMVFAVYGYMNRGVHEGDVGITFYSYDDSINTLKEILYIPYDKSADILMEEMGRLLYMNTYGHIYMTMENAVFRIDPDEKTIRQTGMYWSGDALQTSDDQRLIVTMGNDINVTVSELTVTDLETEDSVKVSAGSGEYIRFLGFRGEDMIYGVARAGDLQTETSGNLLFPMYRICICDGTGKLLKYYEKEGFYVTDVEIEDNRILLTRLSGSPGAYKGADGDNITFSKEDEIGRNVVSVAVIDKYERYVQIQTASNIKVSSLKVTTPGEIAEESVILDPEFSMDADRFYVFDASGICGIYITESAAVEAAMDCGGTAIEENGNVIWKWSPKKTVNQILEIKENSIDEGENALSVCMDVMLGYEGIIRNSEVLLKSGDSVRDILADNMDSVTVLDLTGCPFDSMYFYIDNDIPVLALLQGGGAVLVTGHNEKELVIMDPSTGELYKKDIVKMKELFENNGNQFITYAYAGSEIWAVKTA